MSARHEQVRRRLAALHAIKANPVPYVDHEHNGPGPCPVCVGQIRDIAGLIPGVEVISDPVAIDALMADEEPRGILPLPHPDACPVCGEIHGTIPGPKACPTHGHLLTPELRGEYLWLACPTRGCDDGRWMQ